MTHPVKIRKGHYRATFADCECKLLVPIQFTGHMTFAQLLEWPTTTFWNKLTYVPAPRTRDQNRIAIR